MRRRPDAISKFTALEPRVQGPFAFSRKDAPWRTSLLPRRLILRRRLVQGHPPRPPPLRNRRMKGCASPEDKLLPAQQTGMTTLFLRRDRLDSFKIPSARTNRRRLRGSTSAPTARPRIPRVRFGQKQHFPAPHGSDLGKGGYRLRVHPAPAQPKSGEEQQVLVRRLFQRLAVDLLPRRRAKAVIETPPLRAPQQEQRRGAVQRPARLASAILSSHRPKSGRRVLRNSCKARGRRECAPRTPARTRVSSPAAFPQDRGFGSG